VTDSPDTDTLDVGDWVGVEGEVMTTRRGELSIRPRTLTLLARRCGRCRTSGTA
jgi:lysyl-tRNA synthetase class II